MDVADRVASDFGAAFDSLAASPGMGWRRTHLTGPDLRWWRIHSYLLIYDPSARPLRVIRILHGARDLDRIFRQPR